MLSKCVEFCRLIVVLLLTWIWYGATQTNNDTADYFISALFITIMLMTWVGFCVLLKRMYRKNGLFFLLLFAAVLWTLCCVFVLTLMPFDVNNASVLRHNHVYWLAVTSGLVTVCIMPALGARSANTDASESKSEIPFKVRRARQIALAIVLCLLDLYTLYLLHEIAVIIYEETQEFGMSFVEAWHESVLIDTNREASCNVVDSEMETYGLIYHRQIMHNATSSSDFKCLFQLHESVRLNILCAVVAWTIYRLSTHNNGLHLLCTGMVFLALSTTVDDLRSYWVLNTEQAAFLTVAFVVEQMFDWHSEKNAAAALAPELISAGDQSQALLTNNMQLETDSTAELPESTPLVKLEF